MRIETGSVQFERDWPGIFIRGGDCFKYVSSLRKILEVLEIDEYDYPDYIYPIEELIRLFKSSDNSNKPDQLLKSFYECKLEHE